MIKAYVIQLNKGEIEVYPDGIVPPKSMSAIRKRYGAPHDVIFLDTGKLLVRRNLTSDLTWSLYIEVDDAE